MTGSGRAAPAVRRWPDDPAARQALEEYLAAFPDDPKVVLPALKGGGLDFTGADLSGLQLLAADFIEADLSGVLLVGADLGDAWLIGADLRGADLSGCSLRKAQARACAAQGALAAGADLGRADFEEADLRDMDLRGAHFGRAWMPDADLRGADLRGAVFGQGGQRTGLNGARLGGCRLDGASGGVTGPVDTGVEASDLLDGAELERWFAGLGAPDVRVWVPGEQA